mmetsp:Transcript_32106/g.64045  ORF Transcript_32106/g.64045 Transcript_32106/m.64045 type:complete len:226 (-) Transcript_32106:87-764(-)
MGNDLIRRRRAEGVDALPSSHAFLTMEEVLAVRLYSGPAYQVINGFLRQVSSLHGSIREHISQHVDVTFTATVRHLCCAIRKLGAITPLDEVQSTLYRGVRGQLDPSFWTRTDSMGMLCAVDMAFMSTSKNQETPIDYMAPGDNVLWRLHASASSDSGFHRGADIALFSQFTGEDEILFPPMTMLKVISAAPRSVCSARAPATPPERVEEGSKQYVIIDVLPCFL